eukprot:5030386-Prymnesium_polylepis.1
MGCPRRRWRSGNERSPRHGCGMRRSATSSRPTRVHRPTPIAGDRRGWRGGSRRSTGACGGGGGGVTPATRRVGRHAGGRSGGGTRR